MLGQTSHKQNKQRTAALTIMYATPSSHRSLSTDFFASMSASGERGSATAPLVAFRTTAAPLEDDDAGSSGASSAPPPSPRADGIAI
jgi:hypothetical protein